MAKEKELVLVEIDKASIEEVKRRLKEFGPVFTLTELWGERGRTIGKGEHGHLAAMKDIHYESELPDDTDF